MALSMIMAALLMAIPLVPPSFAADNDPTACSGWNKLNSSQKTSFMLGYMQGMVAAELEIRKNISSKLWPGDYRSGFVVVELDIECEKPVNHKAGIIQIIGKIAERINGAKKQR